MFVFKCQHNFTYRSTLIDLDDPVYSCNRVIIYCIQRSSGTFSIACWFPSFFEHSQSFLNLLNAKLYYTVYLYWLPINKGIVSFLAVRIRKLIRDLISRFDMHDNGSSSPIVIILPLAECTGTKFFQCCPITLRNMLSHQWWPVLPYF